MADQPTDEKQSKRSQNEYMRGGKGRKDEVGPTGIWPASSPDAPADAEIRSEDELVAHRGPKQRARGRSGTEK